MKFAKAMQMLVLLQLLVLFGIMDNSVAVNAETGNSSIYLYLEVCRNLAVHSCN